MGSQISGFGDIHQGDEVGHVFFIETGAVAVPDCPEKVDRRIPPDRFSFVYSTA
jgi:hypothetical protein